MGIGRLAWLHAIMVQHIYKSKNWHIRTSYEKEIDSFLINAYKLLNVLHKIIAKIGEHIMELCINVSFVLFCVILLQF